MERSQCCFYGRGCKRTAAGIEEEWICGRHWRLVPRGFIALHREGRRFLDRLMRKWPDVERVPLNRRRLAILAIDRNSRRWDAIKAAVDRELLEDGAEAMMAARGRRSVRDPRNMAPPIGRGFEEAFARLKRGSSNGR